MSVNTLELPNVRLYSLPQLSSTKNTKSDVQFITSKTPELQMISLGYHIIWDQTLQKLEAIKEVASNKEILNSCLPFYSDLEDAKYPQRMECCELFKECAVPSPDLVIGDEADSKSVSLASKASVKNIWAPTSKTLLTKLKSTKTKIPKSVMIMTMPNSSNALCLALATGAANVVIRLRDFIMSQSEITLFVLLAMQYTNIQVFKPMVSCIANEGAAVYIVCRQIRDKDDKAHTKLGKDIFQHLTTSSKSHYNSIIPEFPIDEDIKTAVGDINKEIMTREISDINDIYNFFKAKNFQGVAMQEFKQRQEILYKKWEEMYAS
jgi:hypothetical protein